MKFEKGKLSAKKLRELYKGLLLPRMIEEKMIILLRQGKVSKWFSGIGQEAVSVGSVHALENEEYILPMHRNLGVFTSRGISLARLFAQFQGKASGFTSGRDRSFHFGAPEHRIVGMISHLGPQLAIADGISLASKIADEKQVSIVFTGDGGASEGDFHEALNVAAVWDLPVIFIVENNGYGLSTPSSQQFRFNSFTDKGPGYGIEAIQIDGNNVLGVYQTVDRLAKSLRKRPRPVLVEAMTFRMRGHEEASGTKYVPKELMDAWALKDPLENYEKFLLKEGIIDKPWIEEVRKEFAGQIDDGLAAAYAESLPEADTARELADMYKPFTKAAKEPGKRTRELRFVDAISEGLHQAMEKHDSLVLMGQDIADYGGVFKVTEGFLNDFGEDRVRNTPLCESAIIGIGLGLSIKGYKSMIEMQFADFVSCGFNQIVNNLAKIHYRWGQNADVVIRMPTGAGVGAGPYHSQSNEAWFFQTPGLKIAYPSNPVDAKGLLLRSFEDPNPVLFFEHKYLYRSLTGNVPSAYYSIPFGQAAVSREGNDLTIVTYGLGVHWANTAAEENGSASIEVIDLRTLVPWDKETIRKSVEKTSRLLVLHEDTLTGGVGAEIAAWASEELFQLLDAPVMRCASLDTAVPFSSNLEADFLANSRLAEKITDILEF